MTNSIWTIFHSPGRHRHTMDPEYIPVQFRPVVSGRFRRHRSVKSGFQLGADCHFHGRRVLFLQIPRETGIQQSQNDLFGPPYSAVKQGLWQTAAIGGRIKSIVRQHTDYPR